MKYLILLTFSLGLLFACSKNEKIKNEPESEVVDDPFFTFTFQNQVDSLFDCFAFIGPDLGGERSAIVKTTIPNWSDENWVEFNFTGDLSAGNYQSSTVRVITDFANGFPTEAVTCVDKTSSVSCNEFDLTITAIDEDNKLMSGVFNGQLYLETNLDVQTEFAGSFIAEIR